MSSYIDNIDFKLYEFKDAILEPYKSILFRANNQLTSSDYYRFTSHSYPKYDYTINNFLDKPSDMIKTEYADGYFVNTIPNYFHMITECLPRLWGYLQYKNENILINKKIIDTFDGLYDILNEYLKFKNVTFLNYDVPKKYRITNHRLFVKNLKMFASTDKDCIKAFNDIKILAVEFWQRYVKEHFEYKKPYRKIFINRTIQGINQKNKRCGNQEEIYDFLKSKDYELLDPNKIDVKSAIKMCYEAKEIIGVHGAGLTNVIFCQPKVKFKQLVHKHPQEDHYKNIANILKLDYIPIYGLNKNNQIEHNEQELFYIKDFDKLI